MESDGVGVGDGDVAEAGQQVDHPGVELHLATVVHQDGGRVVGRKVGLSSQPGGGGVTSCDNTGMSAGTLLHWPDFRTTDHLTLFQKLITSRPSPL